MTFRTLTSRSIGETEQAKSIMKIIPMLFKKQAVNNAWQRPWNTNHPSIRRKQQLTFYFSERKTVSTNSWTADMSTLVKAILWKVNWVLWVASHISINAIDIILITHTCIKILKHFKTKSEYVIFFKKHTDLQNDK